MVNFDEELVKCFLDEATDVLAAWERACLDLEFSKDPENLKVLFRTAHNLKGAARAVGFSELGAFVHRNEDLIKLLSDQVIAIRPGVISILLDSHLTLSKWVEGLRNDLEFKPNFSGTEEAILKLLKRHGIDSNEVEPDETQLDALFEMARQRAETDHAVDDTQSERANKGADLLTAKSKRSEQEAPTRVLRTVRISAQRLDELIQLIGELSVHQTLVYQANRDGVIEAQAPQNAIHLANKLTKELHSKALSLRMQPIVSLFQRLERIIRDVARSQGKKVRVENEGETVELDRTVIERITDPMVHMVRNAVDHGLEIESERIAHRKSPIGVIRIVARQTPAGVEIKVTDDGRGLDRERIRAKAVESGIISKDAKVREGFLQKLIFSPGFSTAANVTDISGRGVGLDVVIQAVEGLRGTIDLKSEAGRGSEFIITLPTSVSILDALVVDIDSSRYAVPMQELSEIIDLLDYRIETTSNLGRMVSLRGVVVPVESLVEYLPSKVKPLATSKRKASVLESRPALVVRHSDQLIAFEVDLIRNQQQVVVRELNQNLSRLRGFAGCTVLGDGEPGLILNLPEIARSYFARTRREDLIQ